MGFLHDLRFSAPGVPRPEFVLNRAPWTAAKILVTGPNYGCGSSREHAVWGMRQLGMRCVIGSSFGGQPVPVPADPGVQPGRLGVDAVARRRRGRRAGAEQVRAHVHAPRIHAEVSSKHARWRVTKQLRKPNTTFAMFERADEQTKMMEAQ